MHVARVTFCFAAVWMACCSGMARCEGPPPGKSANGSSSVVFSVGGAYRDITPERAMPNYNGDRLEPDKGATPLCVQAVVLDDGMARVAVLSVDCTFLGRTEIGRIREALRQRFGLAPEHICIAATHTHAAPATTASFLTGELPEPAYVNLLIEKSQEAVEQSISGLQPARVVAASIDAPPIGFCRRRVDPNGQVYMTGSEPKSDSPLPAENPIDERMQYVVFEDMAGRPLAVACNVACHNNMVSRVFSADMFGRAGDELRAKLGDVATVILAAPCGDVSPRKPDGRSTYASDRLAGRAIADTIFTSYKSQPRTCGGPIVVQSVVRQIPDRPYDAAEFIYDNGRGLDAGAREHFRRRYVPEEVAVREKGATQCDVELQVIAFGEVAIVTNPAELFSIYGVKIKQASPFKVTFVSSLTNGYCGYVPTVDAFAHGGYETYRTVYTSRLAKDAGDRILQESIDLLHAAQRN
jgi:hypothetical protein